ncbi:hypothetical protein BDW74DRAFT_74202 [Aspergillus multicolor]|uniref:uncharacterized protein n=1 Tax=Aspergillus multicolor TaxID=41759 RepID=UPI003CCCD26B
MKLPVLSTLDQHGTFRGSTGPDLQLRCSRICHRNPSNTMRSCHRLSLHLSQRSIPRKARIRLSMGRCCLWKTQESRLPAPARNQTLQSSAPDDTPSPKLKALPSRLNKTHVDANISGFYRTDMHGLPLCRLRKARPKQLWETIRRDTEHQLPERLTFIGSQRGISL